MLGTVQHLGAVRPQAEIDRPPRLDEDPLARRVLQAQPAHVLPVAVVLRERIVFEQRVGALPVAADKVGPAAVAVVLARPAAVVFHLLEAATDAEIETDFRDNLPEIAVRLTGESG